MTRWATKRLGDVAGALQEYRTAMGLKPDHELAIGAYALALAGAGRVGEADTFLTEKRAKSPDYFRFAPLLRRAARSASIRVRRACSA